jgi:hypothetical protein
LSLQAGVGVAGFAFIFLLDFVFTVTTASRAADFGARGWRSSA